MRPQRLWWAGHTSWLTTNTLPNFAANSHRNSIVMRVRLRKTTVGATACGNNFSSTCEWFFTADGTVTTAPTDATALAKPVQRAFRGNSLTASSVQWLRLVADQGCDGSANFVDLEAGSLPAGSCSGFVADMGLKGGLAKDATEQPILFNDGVGSSQMGSVDCDPNIPQGQILTDGVQFGCGPLYARHPFDNVYVPLCPAANSIFSGYPAGNPGPPWNDGRWPPIRCVKTRPTGSMNQLEDGLNLRFFNDKNNPSCPADTAAFAKGRNYWDKDTNAANGQLYGYKEGAHDTNFNPNDPRIVTIFLVPTEAFAGNGQNTYPIAGFVQVYITGYGRIQGNGSVNIDDPCPGSAPPADLDLSGGNSSGEAMWGRSTT